MNLIKKILMSISGKKQKRGIRVVSLFDGMSCARVALENLGIKVDVYISSELDKHAITVSGENYPEIIQLGDVKNLDYDKILELCDGEVDLLIGGSPCTDLSIAKSNREGLKGSKSSLFWNYIDAKEKLNPKYFLLENVASMSKDAKLEITEAIGVKPVNINSEKITPQKRNRLYWTNIEVGKLEKKNELLKDILESGYTDKQKSYCIDANYFKGSNYEMYVKKSKRQIVFENKKIPKSAIKEGQEILLRPYVKGTVYMDKAKGEKVSEKIKYNDKGFRKLTVVECERLQGLKDNYTKAKGVSNTERYRMIGNGFTVSVIEHLLSNISEDFQEV